MVDTNPRTDYVRAHRAVAKARGQASGHPCSGTCGGQASEWCFTYENPDPLLCGATPYSHNINDYRPMCRKCHAAHDREKDPKMEEIIAARAKAAGEGMKRRLALPGGRDVFVQAGLRRHGMAG